MKYKNPQAKKLFNEAKELENSVIEKENELEKANGVWPDYYLDKLYEAAILYDKAEEIENSNS